MNTETIIRLLKQSGLHVIGADGDFIYLEDPACILRSFQTFTEYAWLIITAITGFFLLGWGISIIAGGGAKDYFSNLRNLIIMFAALSVAGGAISAIYGDDIFARGCARLSVPMSDVAQMVEMRNSKFNGNSDYDMYEDFVIYDSGANVAAALSIDTAAGAVAQVVTDNTLSAAGTNTTTTVADNSATTISNAAANTTTQTAARGTRAMSAMESGRDVIYVMSDGRMYRYTGGTRAWRNSNPGNIRYSEFTRRHGAIGVAGGFSVFPDEQTGTDTIIALLQSGSYNKLTVAGAISRYAPPNENDTAAYHRRLQDLTGLSINRQMSDLTPAELMRVASAIRTIEGWNPGQIIPM